MTTDNLQRTIRRSVALLLIPLFLLVIQFDIYLRYRVNLVDSAPVTTSQTIAYVVIVGVVLYLVGSCIAQLYSLTR